MTPNTRNGLKLTLASSVIGIVFLFNFASAQTTSESTPTPTTTISVSSSIPPAQLLSCQEATAQNVNLTLFHGEWFEAARKVQNSTNDESCNAWNFANETNPVTFTSTYNTNPSNLWANQSTPAVQINVTDGVYSLNNTDGTVNIFKILATDYDTFAFICSYRNSTTYEIESTTIAPSIEQSTSSSSSSSSQTPTSSPIPETTTPSTSPNTTANAYILVRQRSSNSTQLSNLTALAGREYSDFKNLTTVIQTEKCTGGASGLMPMISMIMVVVLATFYKS